MPAPSLRDIALLFLKLGAVAFGGPAAHLALMEDEVVRRRRWLSREYFLDLVGATNLIPGPNSTEMAIQVGYIVRGWPGWAVAGICFILPAALITLGFAWAYVQYGSLPEVEPFLYGIKPAVIALILAAVVRLGRSAVKNVSLILIAAITLILALVGVSEIVLILAGGFAGMLWLKKIGPLKAKAATSVLIVLLMFISPLLARAANAAVAPGVELNALALYFLKIGSVLFGSGYVLIAFLEEGVVRDYGWLTHQQLMDAVAAGQFTPGPVLSTATFIGYMLHGWSGALVSTIAIFVPSFVFVSILNPLVPRMRRNTWAAAFLDAINATAIALMAAIVVQLSVATLREWPSWIIAVLSTVVLLRYKLNSALIVVGAAVLGYFLSGPRMF